MRIKPITITISRWIYMLAIGLCMPFNSYAIKFEVKYLPNEWAGFVYHLSQDRSFVSLVRTLNLRNYSFPGELTERCETYTTLEEEQFFSDLIAIKSINEIGTILDSIEDVNQKKMIRNQINNIYQVYVQLLAQSSLPNFSAYTEEANQWMTKQSDKLKDFFDKVATFYGIARFPWDTNIVYPCMIIDPNASKKVIVFYNSILLPLANLNTIEQDFKNIFIILLTQYYEKGAKKLQNITECFFANYPSQYAFFAKKYLNTAIYNVLLHIYFKTPLNVINTSSLEKSNYVSGLSNSIYTDVVNYLDHSKPLDLSFCKTIVHHFTRIFPESIYNISEVLERCCLTSKHFQEEKSLEMIKRHINIYSVFYGDLTQNEKPLLYDFNSPIVMVVRQNELKNNKQLAIYYPFLGKLPSSFFKKINQQKGLYIFRKKSNHIYLFFIVDQYEEIEQLSQILAKKKIFSKEKIMSIVLSSR